MSIWRYPPRQLNEIGDNGRWFFMALCLLRASGMRWSILAAAWMVPTSALAQLSMTITIDSTNKVVTNECDRTYKVSWTANVTTNPCQAPSLWITSASTCSDSPSGSDITLTPNGDRSGTTNTPKIRDLPAFKQADAGLSCPVQQKLDHLVCGVFKTSSFLGGTCDTTTRTSSPPTIEYKGNPPAVPTLTDLAAQDGALTVSVSFDSDTVYVHIFVREEGAADFTERARMSSNVNRARIEGLTNGTPYEVKASAEDQAGNRSDFSNTLKETPVASNGFFRAYRQDGGADTGGCGPGAPGAVFLPLLMCAFMLLKRKRP